MCILLTVLEHLVLCLLLLPQVFLHRLLLFLLCFSLGAALGIDRVIRLCSSRDDTAKAEDCEAKKDRQSFHEILSEQKSLTDSTPERVRSRRSSVTKVPWEVQSGFH